MSFRNLASGTLPTPRSIMSASVSTSPIAQFYGARDAERARVAPQRRRHVVLGDSFVEGYGVAEGERLTRSVERRDARRVSELRHERRLRHGPGARAVSIAGVGVRACGCPGLRAAGERFQRQRSEGLALVALSTVLRRTATGLEDLLHRSIREPRSRSFERRTGVVEWREQLQRHGESCPAGD